MCVWSIVYKHSKKVVILVEHQGMTVHSAVTGPQITERSLIQLQNQPYIDAITYIFN